MNILNKSLILLWTLTVNDYVKTVRVKKASQDEKDREEREKNISLHVQTVIIKKSHLTIIAYKCRC